MIVTLSTAIKGALATALRDQIDLTGSNSLLKFYTGSIPTALGDITTQTLLGTCTLAYPCGTVSGGVLTLNAITQDTAADATGTVTWARLLSSTNVPLADFDVTLDAGNGAIKMNTISIILNGPIVVNSFVFGF